MTVDPKSVPVCPATLGYQPDYTLPATERITTLSSLGVSETSIQCREVLVTLQS